MRSAAPAEAEQRGLEESRRDPGVDRGYADLADDEAPETPEAEAPLDEEPHPDLAPADPYTERPGGDDPGGSPPPVALGFEAPSSGERSLAVDERPELNAGLDVAFVTVRGGRLSARAQGLLDFERALAAWRQVERVVGLTLSPADVGADRAASLEELAAVAEDLGRDVVVIDVREPEGEGEVLVVHAATAALVVRVPRGAEAPSAGELDPWDRLALAAASLD
jgi:hypothetical protein